MTKITVETVVNAPVEKVWEAYTKPEHIVNWNQASEDWHTPQATNDLMVGGRFNSRMEARDGSAGFDFTGVYDEVIHHQKIAYTMDDGRKVDVTFEDQGESTRIYINFDAEKENSLEMQRTGWQAILDSFKKYTEEI